jgi:tetratricopeptide (TPR) repeat protein
MRRLLGHYVHSAYAADRLLNPNRDDPGTLGPPPSGVNPERVADHRRALAWFDAEHPVLLTAIRQVADFDAEIWQLAWTLRRFLAYQGHWQDLIEVLSAALDAARRLADPPMQAFAHCFLGTAYVRFDRYEEGHAHLQQALDLYGAGDGTVGVATTHYNFSLLLERQGRHREALSHAERSLGLFRVAEHQAGQAKALNAIGWFHALLGDYSAALTYCQQALGLQEALGDRLRQADTWDSLGYAHHRLGRLTQAIACYQAAAELFREFDDRHNEAETSASLGDAHRDAGDLESAGAAWQHALDILDELGHPDADEVRTKLKELSGNPS